MIDQFRHRQKNVYFDFLDDKQAFYPDLFKLIYLVEELDIYIKGYVSYRPYCDFWRFMVEDPLAIVRSFEFFVEEISKRNVQFLDFLQSQVATHPHPLYRATCCYFLNKIIKEGTISCGNLDTSYSRLTSDALKKVQDFEYNGNFSVDVLDWSIVDAANLESSALLLLPNQIQRGLVDTGNNVVEKNTLNFGRIRKYLKNKDNKNAS